MKFENVLKSIGNTPVINISGLFPTAESKNINVWIKLERANPGGSIKDRIALAMIEAAEKSGELKPGGVIIEPTSGNTGVGLAMVSAVKGYRLILTMPESMSLERRRIMSAYGAELVLTKRELGMKGAIEKAQELVKATPGAWMPMQFDNPNNPAIHEEATASEIEKDFSTGIDYLITGVGTGGHITGCAKKLKGKGLLKKAFAVEPADSAVLSGEGPGPHVLQGIGAGFIPKVLDQDLLDGVVKVKKDEAYQFTKLIAKKMGILVGVSTGASLAAISNQLESIEDNATVLTFAYDTGERYFSVDGLFD